MFRVYDNNIFNKIIPSWGAVDMAQWLERGEGRRESHEFESPQVIFLTKLTFVDTKNAKRI